MLPFPPVRTAPAIFLSFSTFICGPKHNQFSDMTPTVRAQGQSKLVIKSQTSRSSHGSVNRAKVSPNLTPQSTKMAGSGW
uniref:Uncharacterized protein n=1 Tax=Arundo donax TaxID=35708 RepID=A0A0A9E302_ARUDO